jgi:hypothetical protein
MRRFSVSLDERVAVGKGREVLVGRVYLDASASGAI